MKNLALIFGGKSTEHEISIRSSKNVYQNIDKTLFSITLIYISKSGSWHLISDEEYLNNELNTTNSNLLSFKLEETKFKLFLFDDNTKSFEMDVIFPILHGRNGEDGTIQGLFEISGIPYVGPDVLGSAIAMDKDIAKRLLISAGLEVVDYFCFLKWNKSMIKYDEVEEKIGYPVVVKPANAGSSVGISKATNKEELIKAIDFAFQFDTKILLEKYIKGREIEVAVIGNEEPMASIPGEIVSEFYDYNEKYSSESKTRLDAPAQNLSENDIKKLQEMAIRAFNALDCEGMSRVDFFMTDDKFYINEINTIPGFTNISMYPKLFELSGIGQKELVNKLIDAAISRFERNLKLKNSI